MPRSARRLFADRTATLKEAGVAVPKGKLFSELAMFLIKQCRPFALLTEHRMTRVQDCCMFFRTDIGLKIAPTISRDVPVRY
jgi:hypothetical protein